MSLAPFHHAAVVGDGAMGTLCAVILGENGCNVRLWSHRPDRAAQITGARENVEYLPGCRLPDRVTVTCEPGVAFDGADVVVSAVPCQFMRSVWRKLAGFVLPEVPVICTAKGIELDSLLLPCDILRDVGLSQPMVALSGPSIAPEVALRQPCTVVAASDDPTVAQITQLTFSNDYFRVYTSTDRVGVELAGATKNIIGLAAGILDGLELGCNAKAALLTRGLAEIADLGAALGANRDTFRGLAGVGDLITTCISPVGRNRSAGEKIGRGMSTADVVESTSSVIEGIPTTRAVLQLAAANGVAMPITLAVAAVLDGRITPKLAIVELMNRELRPE